jgi:hypothetical protein
MSERMLLLVKGSEAEALEALRDHGFETTDYQISRQRSEIIAYVDANADSRARVIKWHLETPYMTYSPEGGFPVGTLLLYNLLGH